MISAMPLALMMGATTTPAASPVIFRCTLGTKTATVSLEKGAFVYRYGRPGKFEITISGTAQNGKIHQYSNVYAAPESQLRFSNGAISYVLYSLEGNRKTDGHGLSGLMVLNGTKMISDRKCNPYAEFTGGFDTMEKLPQDPDEYSAM